MVHLCSKFLQVLHSGCFTGVHSTPTSDQILEGWVGGNPAPEQRRERDGMFTLVRVKSETD
jgi:hypothetical protein